MFIAEIGGKPVGRVDAHVDKYRKEKKGFIRSLGVIPEFRRRGVGRALVNKAIQSLEERGIDTIETYVREDQTTCKHLLESTGFKLFRLSSLMKRDLDSIPSNIGENKKVKMRTTKKSKEDIELANWICNEAFRDLLVLGSRPAVLEEWEHWWSEPDFDPNGCFFALLDDKAVGYVGTWIDRKFIKQKGIKKGWISTLGVLKPHRREGIGTALTLVGMEYLKSQGMTEVELETDDNNPTRAIELYRKVGFKVFRKLLVYQKKLRAH